LQLCHYLVFLGTKYFPEVLFVHAFSSGSSKSQIMRIDRIIIIDVAAAAVLREWDELYCLEWVV